LVLEEPIETIKFRMEQPGLSVKDLLTIIGKRKGLCAVLNR
jgi:antitoxin component HigA of HigAB toxin-antitoxin module